MCAYETLPVIATERLVLRGLRAGDAQRLAALAADPVAPAAVGALSSAYAPREPRGFVEQALDGDWTEDARFAIEHRRWGVVGVLAFQRSAADPRGLGPELGYWLGGAHQDLAAEAARAALVWAAEDWGRRSVSASHFAEDEVSGSALIEAGFLYTGRVEQRVPKESSRRLTSRMMLWLP